MGVILLRVRACIHTTDPKVRGPKLPCLLRSPISTPTVVSSHVEYATVLCLDLSDPGTSRAPCGTVPRSCCLKGPNTHSLSSFPVSFHCTRLIILIRYSLDYRVCVSLGPVTAAVSPRQSFCYIPLPFLPMLVLERAFDKCLLKK